MRGSSFQTLVRATVFVALPSILQALKIGIRRDFDTAVEKCMYFNSCVSCPFHANVATSHLSASLSTGSSIRVLPSINKGLYPVLFAQSSIRSGVLRTRWIPKSPSGSLSGADEKRKRGLSLLFDTFSTGFSCPLMNPSTVPDGLLHSASREHESPDLNPYKNFYRV